MGRQPALDGVALAILLFGAVRLDDELRHQRHNHGMAGCHEGRRQHRMVALDLAIGVFARLAMRAAQLLRTEIFGAVERHQRASVKTLERRQAAMLFKDRDHLIEDGLQCEG